MELLGNLSLGFSEVLTLSTLGFCLLGVTLGTFVGVLPGLGATAGMALLLPITASMPLLDAIVLLAGIFYGSMYGSTITSILLNTPGQPASVPMLKDGYALARAGRAGPALVINALASFTGGTISLIVLTLFAPLVASVAVYVGPPEYFAVLLAAITMVLSLAGKSISKAIISAVFGFVIYAVGIDAISGMSRLTYGSKALIGGIEFIPVLIGIYAVSEILVNIEKHTGGSLFAGIKQLYPNRKELVTAAKPAVRGGLLGTLVGLVPGGSAATAAFMGYEVEYKLAKDKSEFGKGEIRGLASSEAANNGAVGGSMVPLLTLGIPADPAAAVLLGAFIIQGTTPGPLFFQSQPGLAWGIIASMYLGNFLLLVLNIPLVGAWASVIRIRYAYLATAVFIVCLIGSYALRNSMFDVWTMIIFGFIGYFMRKFEVPAEPLVLTLILAPIMMPALVQSLAMSGGDPSIFLERPFAIGFILLAVALFGFNIRSRRKAKNEKQEAVST